MSSELEHRLRRVADEVAARTRAAAPEARQAVFHGGLRASALPWVPAEVADPGEVFVLLHDALYRLGAASVPLTVGFTMHAYMYAALATAPIPGLPFAARRARFVDELRSRRWLTGVSSFGNNLRRAGEVAADAAARDDGAGFVVDGAKRFQSMASEADALAFTASLSTGALGFFAAPLRGASGVRLGPALFSGPMAAADTRSLCFEGFRVPEAALLSGDDELTAFLCTWSTSWFEALIGAAYLGGAARALAVLRDFAADTVTAEGAPLAALDGVVVDAGRLALELQTALLPVAGFGALLTRATRLARSGTAPSAAIAAAMDQVADASSLLKHAGTRAAEQVVGAVRRLVGTRALAAGSPLAELSAEVQFGPLHPTLAAELERRLGRALLAGALPGLPEACAGP